MTRRIESAAPGRLLEWDSSFFGLRIASITPAPLDSATMDRALAWCDEQRIDCLYLLSGAEDLGTLRLAQERGFRLVDVRVTFETDLSTKSSREVEPEASAVRNARASDVADLRALAASSHTQTRFWADERFERSACAELYATWIENSCRGYADAVWVADQGGRAAGYLTCHLREDGRGEIGLVAVGPAAQGRGLGRALVDRGMAWFREQGCSRASVVTQGANVAAQRLYQSAGFRTSTVQLWHHRWFDRAATATERQPSR